MARNRVWVMRKVFEISSKNGRFYAFLLLKTTCGQKPGPWGLNRPVGAEDVKHKTHGEWKFRRRFDSPKQRRLSRFRRLSPFSATAAEFGDQSRQGFTPGTYIDGAVFILYICFKMFDTGALYLHDCKIQRFIPIYLVVGGAFALYANIAGLVQSICQQKDPDSERRCFGAFCKVSESLISCFMLAWFIAGKFYLA